MTPAELKAAHQAGGRIRAAQPSAAAARLAGGQHRAAGTDMSALGAKGAAEYARRYGYRRLFDKLREYRISHPTPAEKDTADLLDSLGIKYEREATIFPTSEHPLCVDFLLAGSHLVIEVNGPAHHSAFLNDGNPNGRADRDAARLARLHRRGYKVLTLTNAQVAKGGNQSEAIAAILAHAWSLQMVAVTDEEPKGLERATT